MSCRTDHADLARTTLGRPWLLGSFLQPPPAKQQPDTNQALARPAKGQALRPPTPSRRACAPLLTSRVERLCDSARPIKLQRRPPRGCRRAASVQNCSRSSTRRHQSTATRPRRVMVGRPDLRRLLVRRRVGRRAEAGAAKARAASGSYIKDTLDTKTRVLQLHQPDDGRRRPAILAPGVGLV